MAIAKSNRSALGFGRASARRRRQTVGDRLRVEEEASRVSTNPLFERLRDLTALGRRLRVIYGTAITAELALRAQAAEQDAEIADCLREGLCNALFDAIDRVDEITRHCARERRGAKA